MCPIRTNTRGGTLPNNVHGRIQNHANRSGQQEQTTTQEVSTISAGVLLNQSSNTHINPNWVLLDSESTDHIFCNNRFLTDIETITDGESLRLHTSGGILDTHQKGRFGGFTVWYNPKCLANILSLALVSDQYRVTLDTEVTNAFTVHISAGHDMKFVRYSPGLYLYDASNVDMSKLRSSFSFLQTVSSNKSLFRSRDIRKADAAVSLNRRTNHVATRKFERVIS